MRNFFPVKNSIGAIKFPTNKKEIYEYYEQA